MDVRDRQQFEAMYLEFGFWLKRIACSHHIPPDEIDDVVHDTFLSYVCHNYPMELPQFRMKQLLIVILKSRCMDFYRKEKSQYQKEQAGLRERKTEKGPQDYIISKEMYQAVVTEIYKMPEGLRQVAILRLIQERPTEEVCRILHISRKACYSRVGRIRLNLLQVLKKEKWL